jgi:hypothetical protein
MMFKSINSESFTGSASAVETVVRAELSIGTLPTGAELPNHAVKEVLNAQSLPKELLPHIHEKAKVIGQIHQDLKEIEMRSANAKELEAIRAKLLLGHTDAASGELHTENVSQAVNSARSVPGIALRLVGGHQTMDDWPGMKKKLSNMQLENPEKDRNVVGQADQKQVIGRIDQALLVVDKLLGKIDVDQSAANTRLLNLTGSMAGLNAARSTVDSTPLSLSVAINAAEMIMTNVKAAVVSHGNITTDIVRLVMS